MFNQTAQTVFAESIERALAAPRELVAASEPELSYASGMISYALFRGDISHEQAELLRLRIHAARQQRLARLMRDTRQYAT
ncbi:hypothetical protein N7613_00925 [Pseudomonas juntendi]|uniref:hypothetical protein n=1 Tax=Pseudomonas juntendi TaxID=2666183 RepID=UPI0018E6C26E|nr:hypothetical protein [Pseudomonas juntendi]MBI6912468.1 hypothetical protein [Pseudomonas juntendi]MDG9807193.1 hypothetical protein [Pseudomonas juntendi]